MKKPFDVRVVNYIKKKLELYLEFRRPPGVDEILNEKWNEKFSEGNKSFVHEFENFKITLYQDSILCKAIFSSFEEAEIQFTKRYLKPGDCFLDVGANIGLFSLNASVCVGEQGSVYAFEPAPVTFDRLKANVALNQFRNIKTENFGLSDQNDTLQFHVSLSGYDAWNSFASLNDVGEITTIDVPVISLDEYISSNRLSNISLIKIDVEGWEMNVLKGATELLSRAQSPVLMVEFTEENAFSAGYYCGEIYDFVKSFGYEWFSYNSETNTLEPQVKKLHYPYENLIAIKELDLVVTRL